MPDVPAAERNLRDLRRALTHPVFGILNENRCLTHLNAQSESSVGRWLVPQMREAKDLLLVYYVGHGVLGGPKHDDLYLTLPESEDGRPEFNSLDYDKLRTEVLRSPARTKVIILDACHAERAVNDRLGMKDLLSHADVEGVYVLVATRGVRSPRSIPGQQHTAFTGSLIDTLNRGIRNRSDTITIEELYNEARNRMRRSGLAIPDRRDTREAKNLAVGINPSGPSHAQPALAARLQAVEAKLDAEHDVNLWSVLLQIARECSESLGESHQLTLTAWQECLALAHSSDSQGVIDKVRSLAPLHLIEKTKDDASSADEGSPRQPARNAFRSQFVALVLIAVLFFAGLMVGLLKERQGGTQPPSSMPSPTSGVESPSPRGMEVIATIPTVDARASAFAHSGVQVYTLSSAGAINIYDLNTKQASQLVDLHKSANSIILSRDGASLFVANPEEGSVSEVSIAAKTVVTLPAGPIPGDVVQSVDGRWLYVPNNLAGTVSVIDTQERRVAAEISTDRNPVAVALNGAGSRLYIATAAGGSIQVVDTSSNKLVDRIDLDGRGPSSFAVSRSGEHAYMTFFGPSEIDDFDLSKKEVVFSTPFLDNPQDVVMDPTASRVYVVSDNARAVTAFDAHNHYVLQSISVGDSPSDISISDDGKYLAVANINDPSVSVISTS